MKTEFKLSHYLIPVSIFDKNDNKQKVVVYNTKTSNMLSVNSRYWHHLISKGPNKLSPKAIKHFVKREILINKNIDELEQVLQEN